MDELNVSLDDNTCKFIHEKCHWETYHNEIKYHVTTKYNI